MLINLLRKSGVKYSAGYKCSSVGADIEFSCDERDSKIAQSAYHAPVSDQSQTWSEEQCRMTELAILDQVEDLEERVYQASIYTKVTRRGHCLYYMWAVM